MIDSDCQIAPKGYPILPFPSGGGGQTGQYAFDANNYWSATENNATNSWNVNFSNGNTNNNNKTNTNRVRCVR